MAHRVLVMASRVLVVACLLAASQAASPSSLRNAYAARRMTHTEPNLPVKDAQHGSSHSQGRRLVMVKPTDAHIARMGRMVEQADGSVRFGYPGVRFTFSFTGTSLSMDAWSSGDNSFLEAVIDGGAPQLIDVRRERATFTLIAADKAAVHRVEIMHRSETWHGVVTLASFNVDGKLAPAPRLPARKMLVLGDSVTCSEGVERMSGEAKNSRWWDPRHSYGMLAAQALGAQVQLVCHGGRGLVRSWNNRTDEANLPDYYGYAIADAKSPERWDQQRFDPDLIVSAIGTNDFNPGIPEREAYVSKYMELVRTLLRDHSHARIVLTEGSILSGDKKAALQAYIDETVRRLGSERVSAARSEYYPGDASDGHPTGAQHAQMADDLVPQLKAVMGW